MLATTMPAIYIFVIPLVVWGTMFFVMRLKTNRSDGELRNGLSVGSILCFLGAAMFLQAEYLPSWPGYSVPLLAVGAALLWVLAAIPKMRRELRKLRDQAESDNSRW